ncbi:hypothetical protein FDI24_gp069 [Acidovorax phage ACP17]|uniref:Uncharacterized protein n=1 Tax=Acidovorax phage ACP17 TaxID=2010329 RepID=A0A223AJ06_9CAUD|nr:hypothetical protein FDI24_gp069 [Acidovorax phage ACP17]ASS33933.1 hypothetical protein [Acidovorax phage ACP17]
MALGKFEGNVKVQGEPQAGAIVKVFRKSDDKKMSQATTDSAGHFVVLGLDTAIEYYMIIEEPSGNWNPRVSAKRFPVESDADPARDYILERQPFVYLRFDEAVGTAVVDAAENVSDFTYIGGDASTLNTNNPLVHGSLKALTTPVQQSPGSAVGVRRDNPLFNMLNVNWAIGMVFNMEANGLQGDGTSVLCKMAGLYSPELSTFPVTGDPSKFYIRVQYSGYSNLMRSRNLNVGQTYHIALVQDESRVLLYIDGKLDVSSRSRYASGYDQGNVTIGFGLYTGSSIFYNYGGRIDDFVVFGKELDDLDASNIYTLQTNPAASLSKTYCQFDPALKVGTVDVVSRRRIRNTTSSGHSSVLGNQPKTSGKWYFEVTRESWNIMPGVSASLPPSDGQLYPGGRADSIGLWQNTVWNNGSQIGSMPDSLPETGTIGVAVDLDARKLSYVYAGQTSVSQYNIPAGAMRIAVGNGGSDASSWGHRLNSGGAPFVLTVPAGYNPGWYEET